MIAVGTSSTALSFLKQAGCKVVILGPEEIKSVPHLNRLMMSFSSELEAKIVDFDNALDIINMEHKAKIEHRGKQHSHSYFKNLIEILEN